MSELRTRALYREVNSRIRAISDDAGIVSVHVLCECGADGCLERIEVPFSVIEQVQDGAGARFLVAPGHGRPERDTVVLKADGYSVVAVAADRSEHASVTELAPHLLGFASR